MKIEKCQLSDFDALRELSIYTFCHTYEHLNEPEDFQAYLAKAFNKERFLNELQNPKSFFFFGYVGEEIVGYLKLNIEEAQTDNTIGEGLLEVERIYVLEAHKGKGFGKTFLQKAIAEAKQWGKKGIWLGVWDQNAAAIAFYQSQGFELIGEHTFTLGKDDQIDYVMRLAFDE